MVVGTPRRKEERARRGSCWRGGWPALSVGDAREFAAASLSLEEVMFSLSLSLSLRRTDSLPFSSPAPTSQLPPRRHQNQDPICPSLLPPPPLTTIPLATSPLATTTTTTSVASIQVDRLDCRSDVARLGLERLCRRIGSDPAQERAGQYGAFVETLSLPPSLLLFDRAHN